MKWTAGAATPLLLYLTSSLAIDAMHGYTFTNARHWPAEVTEDSVFVPAGATVTLPFTLSAPDTAARRSGPDVTGRLLAHGSDLPGGGGFSVRPGRALAPGVYLVRVVQAGESATARFVVTR